MPIEIEFVDSCKQIDEALWEKCYPSPFEGLFWYRTLEECGLESQFKFFYALIKSGSETIGIAPCFVHDVPMSLVAPPAVSTLIDVVAKVIPQAGYQRTLFIGSPCAEDGRIGLLPGCRLEDVVAPLSEALCLRARRLKAPMVVFKDCLSDMWPAMEMICRQKKFFLIISYPSTAMDLPGEKLDDYLASLSRGRRHNLKKKLRRSKEEIELVTSFVQRPNDAETEELFGLFMQTFNRGKTKFERLSVEFFKKIRDCQPSWFILQREKASGKLVTFMLLFKLGDKVINKFIGLDYSQAKNAFLYFRQFEAALEFSYREGIKQFQSGQTGYRAKLDLGHDLIPLQNYCRHANPLVNAVYSYLSRDISWATLDSDLLTYMQSRHSKENQVADAGSSADQEEKPAASKKP